MLKGYARSAFWALSWVPVAITFTQTVGQPIWVQGRSMQPTLNPDSSIGSRDLVLVQKYGLRSPGSLRHGDVVVMRSPQEPSRVLVKRIVGCAGDVVKPRPTSRYPKSQVKIPTSHVWVEGDYIHSMDSNYFGPISTGLIIGKVRWIVYPFCRWGPLDPKAEDDRIQHPR